MHSGPPGERIGDLAFNLVSSMNRSFEGGREVSVQELDSAHIGDVFDFLGVSQLVSLPQDTDVTVHHMTVKCDAITALPVQELGQLPVPHLN